MAVPPAQDPGQQRGKARFYDQLLARLAPLGLGLVTEFPQLLAHRVGLTLQALGQKQTDRTQRTRPRQYHPQTPQRQHPRLGFAQLGQVRGDHMGPLIDCTLARHRLPPASWNVSQYPSMPGCRAVLPYLTYVLARRDSLKTLPL